MNRNITSRVAIAMVVLLVCSQTVGAADDGSAGERIPTKTNSAGTLIRGRAARVNINTAPIAELETLPGVGPSTANAIIAARPFANVEDLKRVNGIGEIRFAELKGKVMVWPDRSVGAGSPATNSVTGAGSYKIRNGANNSASPIVSHNKAKPITGKVNINTASKEELDTLPGIGPVKAQLIVNARPFNSPEEIKKVRGIKEGEYAKIRDLITVK